MRDTPTLKDAPHRRKKARLSGEQSGPVWTADQLPNGSAVARFNAALAVKITNGVGSMWCAYAFAVIALISLPQAIRSHSAVTLVSWISQTFLQLVLLSIIIVGQNVLAAASDKRAQNTFENAEAVLHEARGIQQHLLDQDRALADIIEKFGTPAGGRVR
jgi:hypothetical protein